MVLFIGREIRNNTIEQLGVAEERTNPRTGLRIKAVLPDFKNAKIKCNAEKSYASRAAKLFTVIPPKIRLNVKNEARYNKEINELCKNLPDTPLAGLYNENSIAYRVRQISV